MITNVSRASWQARCSPLRSRQTARRHPPAAARTRRRSTSTPPASPSSKDCPASAGSTAERIVEHRQKNGAFKKIEELMNVRVSARRASFGSSR